MAHEKLAELERAVDELLDRYERVVLTKRALEKKIAFLDDQNAKLLAQKRLAMEQVQELIRKLEDQLLSCQNKKTA